MYNLQSGMRRQSFPPRVTPAQARKAKIQQLKELEDGLYEDPAPRPELAKHTKAVTGLMVDSINTTVISCGLDGKLKVSPQDT
jgi:U3 small nucleolar RNA-associated protein 21